MATVLRAYAGTSLIARITWWNPGRVSVVDSSGHVARLRIETVSSPNRSLLVAEEWRLDEPTPPLNVVSLPGETSTSSLPTLDPSFAHLRSVLSDVQVAQPDPEPDPEPTSEEPELRTMGGEAAPPGTAFVRTRPGVWEIRLGATLTRILPVTSRFEIDVENESDPEDVARLVSGLIHISSGGAS